MTTPNQQRPPMIIAVASAKGGTGKTTTAINLALAMRGAVLIDGDSPQLSALKWAGIRADNKCLPAVDCMAAAEPGALIRALAGCAGAPAAIIDTPPRMGATGLAAAKRADVVLLMTRPNTPDLLAVQSAAESLTTLAPGRIALVVNQCSPRTSPARLMATMELMANMHGLAIAPPLSMRSDFAASFANGKGAVDANPDGKAAAEVKTLAAWIRRFIQQRQQAGNNPNLKTGRKGSPR